MKTIWEYLFERPGSSFLYFWPLLIAFSVTLLISIFLSYFYLPKKNRLLTKLVKKYPIRLIKLSIIVILLLMARKLEVIFFSDRFLLFIFLLLSAQQILSGLIIYFKKYPSQKAQFQNLSSINKYLPKAKKKKRK